MRKTSLYHKIWRKKSDELRVTGDVHAAWNNMQKLLDENLPIDTAIEQKANKTFFAKLVSLLGYTLPAAAMIYVGSYIVEKKQGETVPKKTEMNRLFKSKEQRANSLFADSVSKQLDTAMLMNKFISSQIDPSKNSATTDLETSTAIDLMMANEKSKKPSKFDQENPEESAYPVIIQQKPEIEDNSFKPNVHDSISTSRPTDALKKIKEKKSKTKSVESNTPENPFTWGVKLGVTTTGSLTRSDLNKGIIGKLPIDFYPGISATYLIASRWAVNVNMDIGVPKSIAGTYDHPAFNRADTGNRITVLDNRKIYTLDIPILLEFRPSQHTSLKAGPVLSIPIKQTGHAKLAPILDQRDTLFQSNWIKQSLLNTEMIKKINIGLNVTLGIKINRFKVEATYLHHLPEYRIKSNLGTYSSPYKTLQLGLIYELGN